MIDFGKMEDDYEHPSAQIYYVTENIPGGSNSENILQQYNEQITRCCSCSGNCTASNKCVCLSKCDNYKIDDKELCLASTNTNSSSYFECNLLCKCNLSCGNRLAQFGPRKGLIVKQCALPIKGYGLYTKKVIPIGGFVCEYAGEIISKIEAINRSTDNIEQNKSNYIFCLNEYCDAQLKSQTFIDPSKFGNIGRYLNHSCSPNCFIMPVRVDSMIPKLCIFSKRMINCGEELTYDYSSGNINENSVLSETFCLCGSDNCRKYLPFDDFR